MFECCSYNWSSTYYKVTRGSPSHESVFTYEKLDIYFFSKK